MCSPGDHIIEIGANIGTETIGFADIVGKTGRVSAFEPFPTNVDSIRQNATLNNLKQIAIYPLAVGAHCGNVEFVIPPNRHASGIGYVAHSKTGTNGSKIDVESTTLDTLYQELGTARAIFMDVEGAEVDVLRGAREYINDCQPLIVLEAIRSHLKRAGYSFQNLREELERHNYRTFRIGRFGVGDMSLTSERNGNWLCLPHAQVALARTASTMILRCGVSPCIHTLNPMRGPRRQ